MYGGLSYMRGWGGLMIRSMPSWGRGGSFINLNTVNLNIFPKHSGAFTWRLSTDHSIRIKLWRDSSLRLTVAKRFQRLCHVQFLHMLTLIRGIDNYWKDKMRSKRLNLKTHFALCVWRWKFHAKPVFFFNIFTHDGLASLFKL